jgi:hypothetical protein
MTDRFTQIGFSQRIRLEWLEQTARLVLAETARQAVLDALQELLHDKLSVGGLRSAAIVRRQLPS